MAKRAEILIQEQRLKEIWSIRFNKMKMLAILLVLYAYASYVQRICITLYARSKPRDLLEVKATLSAIHSAASLPVSINSVTHPIRAGCKRMFKNS